VFWRKWDLEHDRVHQVKVASGDFEVLHCNWEMGNVALFGLKQFLVRLAFSWKIFRLGGFLQLSGGMMV
jgi:hypothetical protein